MNCDNTQCELWKWVCRLSINTSHFNISGHLGQYVPTAICTAAKYSTKIYDPKQILSFVSYTSTGYSTFWRIQ